jgi:endogenous inhibitor of DNA gyrase (YacG/DUF329 family)
LSAEQRDCPQCGEPFTWTSAAPRQKYCSTRCKHRWHTARRKPRRRRRARQGPTADVARQPAPTTEVEATTEVGMPSPPTAGTAGEAGLAAGPACPHCRKPVALVAWLVPPAAATVREPPRHAGTIRDIT